MIEAAKEYPEVQFSHATGTKAHTENLENFHNAFASIYDGRYLAGIAAGMKLNEMIENGIATDKEISDYFNESNDKQFRKMIKEYKEITLITRSKSIKKIKELKEEIKTLKSDIKISE